MRKNATKLAAAVLSLAMVMTSVSMPASAATTKKAKLNKTSATLFTNGTKSQKGTTLYVTVGGKKVKATFKSSNTKVLTVGKTTGKVTAKKNGTATVKATYKKKTYSCKITVKTYVTSLSVNAKTVNLVKGKTATIKTTVKPSTASNKKVSFKSSNTSVATVTSSGKVTAKKKGSATITVTALGSRKDSKKATVKVNVTEPTVTPTETPVVTETPVPTETPSVATEGTITVTTNITGASITVTTGSEIAAKATAAASETAITTDKIKNGTYTVTISKIGYAAVTKTVVVNGDVNLDVTLEKADGIKVNSVSAVNATTVELKLASPITADYKATFNFDGKDIVADKVEYKDSTVLLTVPEMVDNQSYVVIVKDNEGKEVYNGKVTYDKNEITSIELVTGDTNQQIGTNATVKVKVLNEDKKPVANKVVKLEDPAYGSFEKAETYEATTDENGIAVFTLTRNHEIDNHKVDVFVVEKPTIRTKVLMHWQLADQYVSVDTKGEVTLGTGTYKDYTVTFKNADNSPRTVAGKYVHMLLENNGVAATNITVYYRDLNVKDDNAASAWKVVNNPAAIVLQPDVKTANANINEKGEMKFRIVSTDEQKVTPTFFYNLVGTDASEDLDAEDPRAVGTTIKYENQIPTISLKEANEDKLLATAAGTLGTDAEKNAKVKKVYDLKVTDQFGNPYRGKVKVADYLAVDNIGLSLPTATNAKMDIDTDKDGVDDETSISLTSIKKLNFAYDATLNGSDKNNDSDIKISVYDSTDKEELKLAVFVDVPKNPTTNPNGVDDQIDGTEINVIADKIKFEARKVSSIKIDPVKGTELAPNGSLEYTVTVKDQFGDGVLGKDAGLDFEVAKHPGMTLETTNTNFVVSASNTAKDADASYTTTDLASKSQVTLNNITDTNVIKVKVTGNGASGTTAGDWELVAFAQGAGTSESPVKRYDGSQVAGSSVFTVKDAELAAGSLSGAPASGTLIKDGKGIDYVVTSAADNANKTTFTYTLKNQSDGVYKNNTGSDMVVVWTIVNTGKKDITYWENSSSKTLAAGQTATVKTKISNSNSTTTLDVDGNATDISSLKITAKVEGKDATAATKTALYLPNANQITASAGKGELSGKVVAFTNNGDNDNGSTDTKTDGTVVVVELSDGTYALLKLDSSDYATPVIAIDGNAFAMTEEKFESALSLGDVLSIKKAADALAATDVITLTNK